MLLFETVFLFESSQLSVVQQKLQETFIENKVQWHIEDLLTVT